MATYAPRGSGYTMPSNNRRPTVAAGGPQVAANTQQVMRQPTAPGIGAPQFASARDRVAAVQRLASGGAPQFASAQDRVAAVQRLASGGAPQFASAQDRVAAVQRLASGGGQQSPGFEGNWMFGGSNMGGGQPSVEQGGGLVNWASVNARQNGGQQGGGMSGFGFPSGSSQQQTWGGQQSGGQQGGGQRTGQMGQPNYGGMGFGGGQQGGIFGAVQQQMQNRPLSPEQRWAQQPGALDYYKNMTGDENKWNLANQFFNQPGMRTGQPGSGGADFYNGIGDFARGGIGAVSPYQGGGSQYAGQAADMFNQYRQGAPQPGAAPFQYDRVNAPGYNQPQYDQAGGVGFDPASAGNGPQLSGISDIDQNFKRFNAAGIGGPQNRNISGANRGAYNQFSQDYGDGTIGGTIAREGNRVGRENIQGSGFENNAGYKQFNTLANQGLTSGLGAAQSLATGGGFGIDESALDKAAQRQYELAAQAGANKAIGRGFSPSGGSIGGREIGQAISDKAGELAIQRQQMLLQAEGQKQQGRIAGANALQGIGSTAGGLAGDRGQMLQNESQFLGESALTQRQQDIGQRQQEIDQRSQDITQRGQTLGAQNDIASQRRADFEANTQRGTQMSQLQQQADEAMARGDREGYAEATRRLSALGDINNQENQQSNQLQQLRLQAEEARRSGDTQAYNSLTDRINTMSQSSIGQYNAQTGRYEANTSRGRVNSDAQQAAQRLNYDYEGLNQRYAEMGAKNLQTFNDQMLNAFSGDTDRLQVLTNGMTRLAELDQQGQIEAGRQAIEYGGLMAQLLRDGSSATQAADELSYRAQQGDRDAFIELYTFLAGMGSQREQQRIDRRTSTGDIVGGLISAGGSLGSAYLGRSSGDKDKGNG